MDPDLVGRPFYQLRDTQIRDPIDDRLKSVQQVQLPELLPIYNIDVKVKAKLSSLKSSFKLC